MFSFFSSFVSPSLEKSGPTQVPTPTPFTTQEEVLIKYDQGINKLGKLVGMCQPMTNHYVDLLIKGHNPSTELQDDKVFLKESINEENRELAAETSGNKDVTHYAFIENGKKHTDDTIKPGKLDEKITDLVDKNNHVIINIPLNSTLEHQVYIGRDEENSRNCFFVDFNIRGAERKGPCSELVHQFADHLRTNYPTIDTTTSKVGLG